LVGTTAVSLLQSESQAAAPLVAPLGAYAHALQARRDRADGSGNLYVTEPEPGGWLVIDAFGRVAFVQTGLAGRSGWPWTPADACLAEEKTASVACSIPSGTCFTTGQRRRRIRLPNHIVRSIRFRGRQCLRDRTAWPTKSKHTRTRLAFRFGSYGTNTSQFDFPTGSF